MIRTSHNTEAVPSLSWFSNEEPYFDKTVLSCIVIMYVINSQANNLKDNKIKKSRDSEKKKSLICRKCRESLLS